MALILLNDSVIGGTTTISPRVKWAVVCQMTAPNDTSETSASYSFHELISGCRDCYRSMQVKGLIAVVTRLLSCRLIDMQKFSTEELIEDVTGKFLYNQLD